MSYSVLLVDNSPIFLNILKEAIIAQCPFTLKAFTASSRADALEHIQKRTDWLAVVSGYELNDASSGELINDCIVRRIPTIVLTATLEDQSRKQALRLNIVDYFSKDTNCFYDVAHLIWQLKDNHRHKILIIDDSKAFCDFATRLLSCQNYQVISCNSALEALELLKNTDDITLTLVDYILPDIDGSQLIPRIRKLKDANSLPIIAISAFNEKNIAARMIKAGASDFLLKPVDQEELLLRIRNSLKMLDHFNAVVQAKVAAQQANEAKSYFLSRISHELRTPLNAIVGFSQLLATDEEITEEQVECIEEINTASKHLLHMVNEVLDLSHIESGKLEVHYHPVAFKKLISEAISMLMPMAKQKQIRMVEQFNNIDCNHLNTDPYRLKQILLNLLSNGIKYNKEGGELKVSTLQNEHQIIIEIQDTGLGIPESRLGDLFEPFTRAHNDLHKIEGTGLGLSISKRLAEALSGDLSVTSQEGIGSTFSLSLPLNPRV